MSDMQTQILTVLLMACGIVGIFGGAFFIMFPQNTLTEDLGASIFREVIQEQLRWQAKNEVLR